MRNLNCCATLVILTLSFGCGPSLPFKILPSSSQRIEKQNNIEIVRSKKSCSVGVWQPSKLNYGEVVFLRINSNQSDCVISTLSLGLSLDPELGQSPSRDIAPLTLSQALSELDSAYNNELRKLEHDQRAMIQATYLDAQIGSDLIDGVDELDLATEIDHARSGGAFRKDKLTKLYQDFREEVQRGYFTPHLSSQIVAFRMPEANEGRAIYLRLGTNKDQHSFKIVKQE